MHSDIAGKRAEFVALCRRHGVARHESELRMSAFTRTIGIDYSGAETATASLTGLRVYLTEGAAPPVDVLPPASPRKHWTRRGIAEWLVARLAEDAPTMVGIDHGFSFPLRYFEIHHLPPDWPAFLDDFRHHWPTDAEHIYVDFVRDGLAGNGAARTGSARHAGIPRLRFIRQRLGACVHFWPFDGWTIPAGRSAIAETYPALWNRGFARDDRTCDQHDAFSIAAFCRAPTGMAALPPCSGPT